MKMCLQLAWKNIIKILKWITAMKKTPKKIKVKLRYDLLWNKFVQKLQRLINIPTVVRYWFKLTGIFLACNGFMSSDILGFGKLKKTRKYDEKKNNWVI